jgi:hypothetical protein
VTIKNVPVVASCSKCMGQIFFIHVIFAMKADTEHILKWYEQSAFYMSQMSGRGLNNQGSTPSRYRDCSVRLIVQTHIGSMEPPTKWHLRLFSNDKQSELEFESYRSLEARQQLPAVFLSVAHIHTVMAYRRVGFTRIVQLVVTNLYWKETCFVILTFARDMF